MDVVLLVFLIKTGEKKVDAAVVTGGMRNQF